MSEFQTYKTDLTKSRLVNTDKVQALADLKDGDILVSVVLSDEVLEMKGGGALKAMEASCAGSVDENACAKAFEAAVAAGTAAL